MKISMFAFAFVLAVVDVAAADVIVRRGGESRLVGRIEKVDDAGVRILPENASINMVISWDRVRSIEAETVISMAEYADFATQCWRARSRLERNDHALAEELFRQLFERTRGQTHETALVVAEGLLRCRLARGDNVGAVLPWLETARLRRAVRDSTAYALLPPVLDGTGLCPSLPPLWIDDRGLVELHRQLESYASDDELIQCFATAFRVAVLAHRDEQGATVDTACLLKQPELEILRLVVEILKSSDGDRMDARAALRPRMDSLPPWARAWAHVALGVSVTAGDPLSARREALVELVHVPAMYRDTQPYLTAIALLKLSEGCSALGDAPAASAFAQEFKSHFPRLAGTVEMPSAASQPAASSRPVESIP